MSALYETWTVPALPSPTPLHGLAPIGMGTPMVESLAGYVRRLAASHGLTPGHLVMRIIAPALADAGTEEASNGGYPQLRGLLVRGATAINGNSARAQAWPQALGQLTGERQLARLTLASIAEALPRRSLVRPTRRYCPECLRADRAFGRPAYDRLLWAVAAVVACPIHGVPLSHRCPRDACSSELPHLTWRGQPAHCQRCGVWLGTEQSVGEVANAYDAWSAAQVSNLLAAIGAGHAFAGRVATAIRAHLRAHDMPAKTLARRSGLSPGSLSGWLSERSRPSLPAILRIAYATGLDPSGLLDGKARLVGAPRELEQPIPRRTPIDWPLVRRRLRRALSEEPPRSLRQVVVNIGAERTSVRKKEPELCAEISRRHGAWRRQAVAARDARLCRIVAGVVHELLSEGRCASRREVEERLSSAVSVREPRLYAAWQAARADHTKGHGCYAPDG